MRRPDPPDASPPEPTDAPPAAAPPQPVLHVTVPPSSRTRKLVTGTLTAAAVVATVLSLVALWAFRTLTDTDLFVARVGAVIEEPAVADAVAGTAARRLVEGVGLEQRVTDRLPEELAVFAPAVTGAVEATVAREGADALASEELRPVWDGVLTRTHALAVGLLSGDGGGAVSAVDGVVVLDLAPVMGLLVQDGDGALTRVLDRPAPSAARAETVAELEERVGVALPAQTSQVVLLESADLAAAQAAFQVARTSVWLAPVLALLLVLLALAFSRDRLRTLLRMVVGVAVLLALVRLVLRPVRSALLGAVEDDGLVAGVSAAFDAVFSSLFTGVAVVGLVGVLALAVLGWLSWSSSRGPGTRAGLAAGAR